jgi:hypothetical protein
VELDAADRQRSSGLICGPHRRLTFAVKVEEILRHGAVHLQGEAAVGGFTIEVLGQTLELHAVLAQLVDRPHHLDQGSAEAVEFPDDEEIFGTKEGKGGFECRPLRAGFAGLLFLEDFPAAGALKRAPLKVEILILGRDAGVTYKRVRILAKDRLPHNRIPHIVSLHK